MKASSLETRGKKTRMDKDTYSFVGTEIKVTSILVILIIWKWEVRYSEEDKRGSMRSRLDRVERFRAV